MPRVRTLATAFDPRHNALDAMRLFLASVVVIDHACAIGFHEEPHVGRVLLGDIAVDGFFVISGFLVTRSLLRLRSVRRYAWHRFLRIMPGFWVCLAVTAFLVAPVLAVLSGRSATSVFTASTDSSFGYLVHNAFLHMGQYDIDGLPTGVSAPGVLDGALWTLFYEALCYVILAVLGVLALFRGLRWPLVAATGVAWLLLLDNQIGLGVGPQLVPRFVLVFLLGALAYLFADRVPVSGGLALASAALTLQACLWLEEYRLVAAIPFAYVCLWAAACFPAKGHLRYDLSYGLYVYHFPLQQVLIVMGVAGALGKIPFALLSLPLALIPAAASWILVERPAMGFRNAAWVTRERARPAARGPASDGSTTGASAPAPPAIPARPRAQAQAEPHRRVRPAPPTDVVRPATEP